MKLRKVQMLVAFGVLAAMGGGASLAWACSPQPNALVLSASSGGVGDTVEVTGSRFDGRVEVRWQSADGPVLGRSSASSFTMPVTIPPVPKGVYNIVAVVWNEDGTIYQKQVAPFEVAVSDIQPQPAPPPPSPTDPPGAPVPTEPPEQGPAPVDTAPPPPAIEPEPEPAPVTPGDPSAPPAADTPVAPAPRIDAPPAPAPAAASNLAPAAQERRPAAPAPAAPAPAAVTDSAPAPAPVDAPAPADAAASVPTVTGDLWSGFDSGTSSLTGAESFGTDAPSTDDTGMKAGVALLVAGLIALCMAGAATAVSRRRAVAVNDSNPASDI